jgi:hypothetical protein
MPTAGSIKAPPFFDRLPASSMILGAAHSLTVTFNTASKTATANPANPYKILDGTDTNADKVNIVAVPSNATYLDLYHFFSKATAGAGTLTTLPIVRVFGEIPIVKGNDYVAHPISVINNSSVNLVSNGYADWIPLTTAAGGAGSTSITVGDSTDAEPMTYITGPATGGTNAISRSAPASILVKGVRRIIVTIKTAAVGTAVETGVIGGNFRC